VLCGHIDTVSAAGMDIEPFAAGVQDGRVYGRGGYDMKGGVAAIMAAAAVLAREALPGRVLLALVCDEEHASLGADDFVRRHTADGATGCILTEPSDGALVLAHKGFVWAELVTEGVAAHGSRWQEGVSAVGRMARIVAELERFDREELRRRTHPLLGPASLHCATIAGGTGFSTYAAECRLRVERRTLPGETAEQVERELLQAVERAGERAQVTLPFHRAPLESDRASPVATAVRSAAAAVTGREPAETGVAYWMDAAVFAGAGIPAVDFGGTGAGAHAAVEWTEVDSWVVTANVLVEAARRFCS
jgi:acetylornithine deacetylase